MERTSLSLANWFLDRATRDGRTLTLLQVLKLVYIAHGWHLGLFGRELLSEDVEAWKHGPAIRSIYRSLFRFGGRPITGRAVEDVGPDADEPIPPFCGDEQQSGLLEAVWQQYRELSGGQFIDITHKPGTPWSQTWDEDARHGRPRVIDNALIRQHYEEKARRNAERQQDTVRN